MIQKIYTDFGDWLSNLTKLRIERYSPAWIEFLCKLNDTVHRNLCELTLQNLRDVYNAHRSYQLNKEVVNEIVRFPNLKSLDLLMVGYENANTKFLFKSCSKLEVLSITMRPFIRYQILEDIKKICNKLETLIIVVKRSSRATGLLYLDEVRKYFPPKINIKVYEADNWRYLTKGFMLDKEWLDGYKKFRSSVHD